MSPIRAFTLFCQRPASTGRARKLGSRLLQYMWKAGPSLVADSDLLQFHVGTFPWSISQWSWWKGLLFHKLSKYSFQFCPPVFLFLFLFLFFFCYSERNSSDIHARSSPFMSPVSRESLWDEIAFKAPLNSSVFSIIKLLHCPRLTARRVTSCNLSCSHAVRRRYSPVRIDPSQYILEGSPEVLV